MDSSRQLRLQKVRDEGPDYSERNIGLPRIRKASLRREAAVQKRFRVTRHCDALEPIDLDMKTVRQRKTRDQVQDLID